MESAYLTAGRLLPLYLLVLAGYFAGSKFKVRKEDFAALLIYLITPAVVFVGVVQQELDFEHLALPFVCWLASSIICLIALRLAGLFFSEPTRNALAFTSADTNSGYFGIPIGIALFGESAFGAIVFCSFGFLLFENTVGFYVTARGAYSVRQSLNKVLKLPVVYAFALGVIANIYGLKIEGGFQELALNIRGAYSVLGMMLIGFAVAEHNSFRMDVFYSVFACAVKFVAFPLLMACFLWLDSAYTDIFGPKTASVLYFMSSLPIAANTVAITALLGVEPKKTAMAVLLSTVLAIFFVPLWQAVFA